MPLGSSHPAEAADGTSRSGQLAIVLVAVLAIVLTFRPVDDFDVWYHLAAGRLMINTWRWPTTNTFAFTTPLHPWVDVHWVFQLLLYGVWLVGGGTGAILLTATLVLATVAVLYSDARRFAPRWLVTLLLTVALMVASPRFVPRPELVGFLLIAVFLWLLDDYPRCGRALYLLVPLQILWMNAHGTVPIGVVLVGCYWLGATLAVLPGLPAGWRAMAACALADWRRLTIVLALVTVACFATPWGVAGALLSLDLLPAVTGGSLLSSRIGEFRPPFQSGYGTALAYTWAALLVVAALSFAMNFRRVHLGRLFTVVVSGYLSTQALRNVGPFAWIAVPATAANLGDVLARRSARRAERGHDTQAAVGSRAPWRTRTLAHVGDIAVVTITTLLIASIVTNRLSKWLDIEREFGLGISKMHAPIDALRFADEVGIAGRPFNDFASGGYLAWARFPQEHVFVDGRTQAYPDDFFRIYFSVIDDPKQWPEIVSRFAPDYALLYHVWANRLPLARFLSAGHGWTLVYYDETASLYMPLDEAHRETRERADRLFEELQGARGGDSEVAAAPRGLWDEIRVPVAAIHQERGYGAFLSAVGRPAEAARAYERALALDPEQPAVRTSLGFMYWQTGRPQEAVAEWREAVRRDPSFEPARNALAEGERRISAAQTR
jgi:hypothetical protein